MTIARRGLKVKVMCEANAVGPTSIDGSFFSSCQLRWLMCVAGDVKRLCETVGLAVETVLERRAHNERLSVLRCMRRSVTRTS